MRGPWGLAVGGLLLFGAVDPAKAAVAVDVALVLAGDVSGSMTPDARWIEREGLAVALRDPDVLAAIGLGGLGRIAVTYVEWAGPREQWQVVPWTIIGDRQAAEAFAARLVRAPVVGGKLTSLSAGLLFAARQFPQAALARSAR